MKTIEELNEKVAEEIASFARLHAMESVQVTGFWDMVEICIGRDTSNKSEVAKKAAAVRRVVHNFPYTHMQLRQQLLAEANLPGHEKQEGIAEAKEEAKDYDKFLYEPLEE